MPVSFPLAITVDVHPNDNAMSIRRCVDFLAHRNISATFLISTAILQKPQERAAIKSGGGSHELGTHAHQHDADEIRALVSGRNGQLNFLRASKESFEDSFGYSPRSFRSPTWCGLGSAAIDELVRLGYMVDCSSTPQRPGILSSYPLENPWLLSSRKLNWLRLELLEIPTSTFLLPLASPSFAMLGRRVSKLLVKLLMLEARKAADYALVLSFDIEDFDRYRGFAKATKNWRDLMPLASGGLQWRYWLRTYDPEERFQITLALFEQLKEKEFVRLSDIYSVVRGVSKIPLKSVELRNTDEVSVRGLT
jgi:peptidoglycan/xylan/chitin deacetylase (PgdA/CDA1 family)